jgi:trigger factor
MSMDVSSLQVTLEEGANWSRTLSVVVPSGVVQSERQAAVRKLAKQLRVPGFRAGKVPTQVIEKRFGAAINQELVDRVVQEAFREVLKDRDLRPISESQVSRVDFDGTSDLSFDVQFEVAPVIHLETTGGFTIERPPLRVGQEEVDGVLARLQDQRAEWVAADEGSPKEGDRVTVYVRQLAGEAGEEDGSTPYEFVLGGDEAIPDVEKAIMSLAIGEEGDFTVVFPDDFEDEDKRGKEDTLRIKLDQFEVRALPPLDDAFARAVADLESIDALRDRIDADLRVEASREQENVVRHRLLDALVAANPFDVPQSMVDRYIRSMVGEKQKLSDAQMEVARAQLGAQAEMGVKVALALEAYIDSKGISVSEDDIDARIEELASGRNMDPAELYAMLQRTGQMEHLERELLENRAFASLEAESTLVDGA